MGGDRRKVAGRRKGMITKKRSWKVLFFDKLCKIIQTNGGMFPDGNETKSKIRNHFCKTAKWIKVRMAAIVTCVIMMHDKTKHDL